MNRILTESKIQSLSDVKFSVARWRFANHKIVFTNGCFDLLHYGHLQYLLEARELGGQLIIGLNSDASVQRLKGNHRPIKDERSRAICLAAMTCVSAVVLFEQDTPLSLIMEIQPDVLVKGGDWKPEQIVGGPEVLSWGGEVLSLPFVEGYSTTKLEEKIIQHSRGI